MAKDPPKAKSKLLAALEDAMYNDLKSINAQGLIPGKKDGEQQQGPIWAPKDRVALYETVTKYVARQQESDGPGWGSALKGERP